MNAVFCPAYNLSAIVDPGGIAAVAAMKRGQCSHLSVLPAEALADPSSGDTGCEKRPAGKIFAKRIGVGQFGNSDDDAIVAFDWPGNGAVRPILQGAERNRHALQPQGRHGIQVSGKVGGARDPAAIVNAVGGSRATAKLAKRLDAVIALCH